MFHKVTSWIKSDTPSRRRGRGVVSPLNSKIFCPDCTVSNAYMSQFRNSYHCKALGVVVVAKDAKCYGEPYIAMLKIIRESRRESRQWNRSANHLVAYRNQQNPGIRECRSEEGSEIWNHSRGENNRKRETTRVVLRRRDKLSLPERTTGD